MSITARFEWRPRDLWIGGYWERRGDGLHIWLCLVPMLPLHITRLLPEQRKPEAQS